MSQIELLLEGMGLTLPPAPPPGGIYHPVIIMDKTMYVSGQVSVKEDGTEILGTVGKDMTVEEGKVAARYAALCMIAAIKNEIGNLDRIKRLIKTLGMVNCLPGFDQQPQVINGFSELWVELLGPEYGKGARSAVGMILPQGCAVEVEAIFELK